ncbi:MAG: serine/threonine protein kinase [Gammaproteobacteria bacterium]|nr:serine/threonine protein kinase [Gammaproteobacteria bacterium]MDH5304571.1 serine/threonine protein kinase [Gammaproteobacteria bacterium]MDH5322577.1 serine/threonine protein kinase [Gammaproteobacteria bacterium]
MTVKFMIIDGQRDFRKLLMHHLTVHWPDAIVSEFDPTESGHLPAEFSGAGNDMILLGSQLGDRQGTEVLKQFLRLPGFPPTVYFGAQEEEAAIAKLGADGFFLRHELRHKQLIVRLSDILKARQRVASTGSLFVGDQRTGIHPLIRGYRFIKKLSASNHSSIYLAEKESNGHEMVLKVLRQVPDVADSIGAFDRFLQEYELIAGIDHPNVVKIHDLGVGDDHAHIAMEYLDGGDLKQRIASGVSEADAVCYLRQIASALARVHLVGILHRDLKPGNIMLRRDDSVALIDFGLAKRMRLAMEITDSGEIFGTPYYMSPEQGHGNEVDLRSDIYSLGVIFFEMLTGKKPFRADSAMGIIYLHAKAPLPLLPRRFAKYQALLNMMLAKQPEDRLQNAAEVEEWL